MSEAAILAVLREELCRLAPAQQQFDIDPMDFLNCITAIRLLIWRSSSPATLELC